MQLIATVAFQGNPLALLASRVAWGITGVLPLGLTICDPRGKAEK